MRKLSLKWGQSQVHKSTKEKLGGKRKREILWTESILENHALSAFINPVPLYLGFHCNNLESVQREISPSSSWTSQQVF